MEITGKRLVISFTVLLFFLVCRDGKAQSGRESRTLKISGQEWMAENLSVDHYWDGRPIPEAKTIKEWNYYNEHKIGCWCNYDNEACYGSMYANYITGGLSGKTWRPAAGDYLQRPILTG